MNRRDDLAEQISNLDRTLAKLKTEDRELSQRLLLLDPALLAAENRAWHRWLADRRKRVDRKR